MEGSKLKRLGNRSCSFGMISKSAVSHGTEVLGT
jgi:hypothetical protein